MKIGTDHRPKRRKVYLSSKSHFQRLGRESAGLNLKRHSRPLVRVQINLNHTYFVMKKIIYLDEESIKFKNTVKTKPNQYKKLKNVFVFCDTGYVADMIELFFVIQVMLHLLFEKVFVNPTPYTDVLFAIPVPEDLSAQYEKPDKEEVIASFVSRFKRGAV